MPIGMPGWPDLARSTASIAKARTALALSLCIGSTEKEAERAAAVDMDIPEVQVTKTEGKVPESAFRCKIWFWRSSAFIQSSGATMFRIYSLIRFFIMS